MRVWFLDFHRDPPPQVHRSLRLQTQLPHPFQSKVLTDFFEAIENERTTIFNLQPGRCVLYYCRSSLGSYQSRLQLAIHRPIPTVKFQPFPGCRFLDKPLPTVPSSNPNPNRLASCNLSSLLYLAPLSSCRTLSRHPPMLFNHK